ncbi:uncharacterized protein LODBEIA_P38390 [Lodderomyces beijingensis]|uniref:Ubiquitin-like domain-containing protein n=1 Tax=Lodderomyces beijingensis TaxID=1775926 RepID=A0ABP0ZTY0_9ASCO
MSLVQSIFSDKPTSYSSTCHIRARSFELMKEAKQFKASSKRSLSDDLLLPPNKRSRTAPPSPPYELKSKIGLNTNSDSLANSSDKSVAPNSQQLRSRSLSPSRQVSNVLPPTKSPLNTPASSPEFAKIKLPSISASFTSSRPSSSIVKPQLPKLEPILIPTVSLDYYDTYKPNDENWRYELLDKITKESKHFHLNQYNYLNKNSIKTKPTFDSKISFKLQHSSSSPNKFTLNPQVSLANNNNNNNSSKNKTINFPFESNYTYLNQTYLKDVQQYPEYLELAKSLITLSKTRANSSSSSHEHENVISETSPKTPVNSHSSIYPCPEFQQDNSMPLASHQTPTIATLPPVGPCSSSIRTPIERPSLPSIRQSFNNLQDDHLYSQSHRPSRPQLGHFTLQQKPVYYPQTLPQQMSPHNSHPPSEIISHNFVPSSPPSAKVKSRSNSSKSSPKAQYNQSHSSSSNSSNHHYHHHQNARRNCLHTPKQKQEEQTKKQIRRARYDKKMPEITVTIKSSGDTRLQLTFDPSITVLQLKELIGEKESTPVAGQRLIYSGKVLKDDQTVESYKVQDSHTIHLVKGSKASSSTPATSTAAANASASANTSTNASSAPNASQPASNVPSNIAAGQGSFNPLADLTGARYAGYTQLPSASLFGPDGGMNSNLPNEDQMNEMMSNPLFQEQMNSMLSNPQMLDFLIQQNPQLRALGPQARQMLQSPLFRQMLTNPELMRSAMQMGRQGGAGGAAGGNIFGGGDNPLFPAPGANPTVERTTSENASGGNQTSNTTGAEQANAANPFAGLFPGGVSPVDPMAFFGGAAGTGANPFASTPPDNRPPEERYESQLRQLNDMGFFDFDRNIEALRRTGGSVQGAIEYLLNSS